MHVKRKRIIKGHIFRDLISFWRMEPSVLLQSWRALLQLVLVIWSKNFNCWIEQSCVCLFTSHHHSPAFPQVTLKYFLLLNVNVIVQDHIVQQKLKRECYARRNSMVRERNILRKSTPSVERNLRKALEVMKDLDIPLHEVSYISHLI